MPNEWKYILLARCPFGHPVDLTIMFKTVPGMVPLVGFEPVECETCKEIQAIPPKRLNRLRRWWRDRKMDKELRRMMEGK